ncbi:MAG TPA: lysylphosphatidylglycerol synthase transmembrane domain-containing protein [Solirubrobacteraceae bacterium]
MTGRAADALPEDTTAIEVAAGTHAPVPPPSAAGSSRASRAGSRASMVGIAVSLVAVAGVVWWALHQDPPQLPSTPGEIGALLGAIALYALATVVRAERWERLLARDRAHAPRADVYALTVVGYAVNNVLPARAGDAVRVLLLAPRTDASRRTILGTLVAERLLDVAVVLGLFLFVGYALLGNVGAGSLEIIGLATLAALALGAVAVVLVRRNARLHALLAPILSSTLNLRGRHGLALLAVTVVIWALEGGVWMSVGAAVGFAMDPIEALYLVALASVFALIPSGPGYAGTQDAAAAIGIKAIGGTGSIAVSYLVTLRFVIIVPITLLGFVFIATRYGGIARLRAARREAAA